MLYRRFPGAASLLLAVVLLVQAVEGSHVETFSDSSCQDPLTDWYGPNNGECTNVKRNGNWTSFRILNLQQGCAITIYGPGTKTGPCDSNAAPGAIVAQAGTCYNTTWTFYSIDGCKSAQTTHSASLIASSSSGSGVPSSTSHSIISTGASSTSTPEAVHQSHTNVGAIVGGVIGGVAFGIIVAAVGIVSFMRYRRVRRNRPPEYPGAPGSSHGLADMAAKELPGGGHYHESRPGTARSAPGTPGGAQELPTERIPELGSYPIAEMDSGERPKSPHDGLKT